MQLLFAIFLSLGVSAQQTWTEKLITNETVHQNVNINQGRLVLIGQNYTGIDPEACDALGEIKEVIVPSNRISSIPKECDFSKTKFLVLAFNNISHIPKQLFTNGAVQELDLEYNPIQSIDLSWANYSQVKFQIGNRYEERTIYIWVSDKSNFTIKIERGWNGTVSVGDSLIVGNRCGLRVKTERFSFVFECTSGASKVQFGIVLLILFTVAIFQ